jgi:hypothetical protein
MDSEDTQLQHEALLDDIFQTVRDNPTIQKFQARRFGRNTTTAVYNLLSQTKSLPEFIVCNEGNPNLSIQTLWSIAGGMSRTRPSSASNSIWKLVIS